MKTRDGEVQESQVVTEIRLPARIDYNHFNLERYLYSRQIFKRNRSVALAEWRQLAT